jgi:hypothetical protein
LSHTIPVFSLFLRHTQGYQPFATPPLLAFREPKCFFPPCFIWRLYTTLTQQKSNL